MRVLRAAMLGAIFATALLATAAAIRARLPFPPVSSVREKVAWLAAHGDDYGTLFLGSSRTYHHIVPELFDRLMSEAGFPTRSFNLGLDGMRPPEDSFILETVLEMRRTPLRFVLVESNDVRVKLDRNAEGTQRLVYWHDWKRLGMMARATLWATNFDEEHWTDRAWDRLTGCGPFLDHLRPALARAVNLGRGAELRAREKPTVLSWTKLGERRDGYFAGRDKGEISAAEWKKLQTGVAARLAKPAREDAGDAESQRVLQEKRRWVEAHGGKMFLFLPPTTDGQKFVSDPRFGPRIPVLDFIDPAQHPELYEARHREDEGHLNPAGAELFTRLLAEHLLTHLRAAASLR